MLYVYYSNENNANKINLSQEEEFLVLGRVFLQ
ncbi:hypothetical protein Dhaf_4033 [Desulfitobacterium hafniense DCB-2]|uniref:Uncharacterized protein n=1 Tax=Desulfitobacterium hafniense (strain DSM 10664 / DCB-2) TaxID=272564 RepID=B8FT27_DESHD|nr:hypothetical protein Dhaf_4033 [Desulfitobacterium hafniense DCB-2]